jgi:hypothetical protein
MRAVVTLIGLLVALLLIERWTPCYGPVCSVAWHFDYPPPL